MAKKMKTAKAANAMDYPEHENTYSLFIKLTLWLLSFCVVMLVSMAFGFFGGGGLIGGSLLFLILMVACYFAL